MRKRICLLGDKALKDEVLNRAHESRIIVHPGNIKMYRNLKEYYWWPRMKREIVEYVTKYAICQQAGPLQPLLILEWKWELITMDFVFELPRSKNNNNAI